MSKPVLHFAHANSFPAGTYRKFFDAMDTRYAIQALPLHAHDPAYPIKGGWRELSQELVADIVAHNQKPVILVGHSMGGILSLLAAKARPDLVRGVVLLDAPVVAGWRALAVRVSRNTAFAERFSPAQQSVKRRNLWPDAEAAYEHFSSKDMFAKWAPGVLRDYIEHGLVVHPEGVTLRFTREAETAVYLALPDNIDTLVWPKFPVPVGFLGGDDSAECRMAGMGATRRLVGTNFRQIKGGHLFPMESPQLAADMTHELIQSMFSK